MSKATAGPRPAALNVVAVLYRWAMRRSARGAKTTPVDLEFQLSTDLEDSPRTRDAVPFVMRQRNLEIVAVVAVPGAAALFLSNATEHVAAVSLPLRLVGFVLMTFPAALLVVVGIWSRLPERRTGGYLRHPERLWVPSILTLLLAIAFGGTLFLGTVAEG